MHINEHLMFVLDVCKSLQVSNSEHSVVLIFEKVLR